MSSANNKSTVPGRFEPSEEAYLAYLKHVLSISVDDEPLWLRIVPSINVAMADNFQRFAFTRNRHLFDEKAGVPVLRAWHYSSLPLILHSCARDLVRRNEPELADRVYFASVSHTSCDLFPAVALPIRTVCDHPLGAVIGRAEFAEEASLQFSSGSTIGNNAGVYPTITGHLLLMPQSSLLGDTQIAGNVVISRGAVIKDAGQIKDSIVFENAGQLTMKPLDANGFAKLSLFR
jgi:serine O-acetyltransferase